MKIIHLLKHGMHGNGHVHVAVDLACAQAAAGHEVWFVQGWGSYDELLARHGVGVVSLTAAGGLKGAPACALEVLRLVRRTRPDVLHAHMMSSAVFGFLAGVATRTPLITTMHNSFDRHSFLMRLGRKVVAV
uniref:glycosyltransferase family 4 protein n=1 Tax=Lapillicoccus sp. TaxID=1909287 RepID=UPI0025F19AFB